MKKIKHLSAQKLFNGPGFDDVYMKYKAKKELERIKHAQDLTDIYDHVMNFSVTIAAIADWTFHIKLANLPKWKNRDINFTHWVRSKSREVGIFIDIANEFKHANRKHSNFYAESIELKWIYLSSIKKLETSQKIEKLKLKGFINTSNTNEKILFIPTIRFDSNEDYLYDIADAALEWWNNVDISTAKPMNKDFLPIE